MPRALAFKQRYIDGIRRGEKDSTIRLATTLQRGDLVPAICRYNEPPFARLLVRAVLRVELSKLTNRDARRCGALDADEARANLRKLYSKRRERLPRYVFLIRFTAQQ